MKTQNRQCFAFFVLAMASGEVLSETQADLVSSPSMMIGKVIFYLVIIVLGILASAWLVKRTRITGLNAPGGLKVLSTLPVGTREKIALIEVENKKILLGITSGGISNLHVFDQHEDNSIAPKSAGKEKPEKVENEKQASSHFSEYLAKVIKNGTSDENN